MSMLSPVLDAIAGQLLGSGLRVLHATVTAAAEALAREIETLTGQAPVPADQSK